MRRFEVLKVVFRLSTPLLLNHPWIMFDGLVTHVMLRRELGDDFYNLPSKYPLQDLVDSLDVPIRRAYYDVGKFFYDCSASIVDGQFYPYKHMYVTHVRKRFCEKYVHEVRSRRGKVELSKGHFKLFDIKFMYVPCREVTFYVSAVEDELVDLLRYVTCIGKKRAEGFGFVKSWTYEKTELRQAYMLDDGTVTRPLPALLVDIDLTAKTYGHVDLMPHTVRPPYWNEVNVELCTIPGRRYVLKSRP